MAQVIQRTQLFLGAYVLLFTLVPIRFEVTWLGVACAALAALGLLDTLWIVFGVTRRKGPSRSCRQRSPGPALAMRRSRVTRYQGLARPSAHGLRAEQFRRFVVVLTTNMLQTGMF